MTKTDHIIAGTAAVLAVSGITVGAVDLVKTGDVSGYAFLLLFSWFAVLVGYAAIRPRRP